jgi:DNA-binding beta-propeller fold protein YncE
MILNDYMEYKIKTILFESLKDFIAKDVIINIIFTYITAYSSEKLVNTLKDEFYIAQSIAVSDKLIFVANSGRNEIRVYGKKNNNFLYSFGRHAHSIDTKYKEKNLLTNTLNNITFNFPGCIAIDNNILYITDSEHHIVQLFKINNTEVSFHDCFGDYGTGDKQFDFPYNVIVQNNEIYIGDINNHKIKIFDKKNYKFIRSFYCKLYESSCDYEPFGFSVDDKYIYISNPSIHKIQVHDKKTFLLIKEFGEYGTNVNQYFHPRHIGILDNEIFVADYDNFRIQILDKSFAFIRSIVCDEASKPHCVTIYNNRIYVLCAGTFGKYKLSVFKRFL